MSKIQILDYSELLEILINKNKDFKWDTLFYSQEWIQILQKTYSFKIKAGYARESSCYIIFAEVENSFGKKLVSLPFSDYIAFNPEKNSSYMAIASELEKVYPNYLIHLKTNLKKQEFNWGQEVKSAFYHQITFEDTKDGFKPSRETSNSFKRAVKKAIKNGVHIELSKTEEALDRFYKMNAEYRILRFQKVPQPYSFFKNIFQQYIKTNKGFILEAKQGDSLISAALVLEYNNIFYYKFGCSKEEFLHLRPNNYIFQYLIEYACEQKKKAIDLGLSGSGEAYKGLRRFKESMGAVENPITYFEKNSNLYPKSNTEPIQKLIQDIADSTFSKSHDLEQLKKMSQTIYPFFA